VCGEVLGPYLHPRGRRSVAKQLAKLGVTVLEGSGAKVAAVTRDAVQLSDGRELPSTLTIWTAGFGLPDLAARSGLSTDTAGRLLTDETLTSLDDVRIVAAGDSAAPSDLPYRMSAYAAQPLGAHAADTVLSRIAGKQPTPINLGFFGLCISLGCRAATAQFAHKDDTATSLTLEGQPGPRIGGRTGRLSTDLDCMSRGDALSGRRLTHPFLGGPLSYGSSVALACHSRAPDGAPSSIAQTGGSDPTAINERT
jgi:NADH dehydrogenase